jgi:signal transduction histidine kinase
MFRLFACISEEHDIRLVVLAGLICVLGAFTAFSLLRRAAAAPSPRARLAWLSAAAIVAGSGVWTTHFLAMLAYTSHLPIRFDSLLTVLSVVMAISISFVGLALALQAEGRTALVALGGAIVGAAVGSMHFIGMSAMQVPAMIVWDGATVVVALLIGMGMASVAVLTAFRRADLGHRIAATTLLVLGICGLHFTAMTAFELKAYPDIAALIDEASDLTSLAIGVAAVTAMIISFALVGAIVDQRLADRAVQEAARLRAMVTRLETTKRELEATTANLTRALEAAAAASQAKSQFLATMSHELRTPLNAVIGFSQILASELFGPLGDPRYRDYSRTISESGTHLLNLINDVLDFSKSEAGKLELHEEPVDLAASVDHAIRIVSGQAQAAELAMIFEPEAGLQPVRADAKRVKQILLNLLSNAIKFTPAEGRITVTAYRRGDAVAVDVADTGVGIAAKDMPTALERFGQVDRELARKHEGTGLGLPLSKRLMDCMAARWSCGAPPASARRLRSSFRRSAWSPVGRPPEAALGYLTWSCTNRGRANAPT